MTLTNEITFKADSLHEGFELLTDGQHNIRSIRTIPVGILGRCELQVLFNAPKGGVNRYHYQDVHIASVDALKLADHPTQYLAGNIKPVYHCYRADVETGKPYYQPAKVA